MKRQLDICGTCYRSAYVDEGQVDFSPMSSPDLAVDIPFECRFTCKECVERKAAN